MAATIGPRVRAAARLFLAFLIILLAMPTGMAAGDSAEPPWLVMKWKWGSVGQFNNPWSVAVDADNFLYVADTYNDLIKKFDAQGNLLVSWGGRGAEPGKFYSPQAVVLDHLGNVLVADTMNKRIQRFTPDGVYLQTITSPVEFSYNRQMAVDAHGSIYVSDDQNHRIQKFDAEGNFLQAWNHSPCMYFAPGGMVVDADGNLLVINASCDTVEKYSSNGEFLSQFTITTGWNTAILGGMALNSLGQIIIVDQFANVVGVYSAEGQLLRTFGGFGAEHGQFNSPAGIAVGPDGKIYIADSGNNRVQTFDADGGYLSMIASDQLEHLNNPDGVAANSAGAVYVADSGNNRIMIFDKHGKVLGKIGTLGTAPGSFSFAGRNELEIDAQDNLYVADPNNYRIQKFDPHGNVEKIWKIDNGGYDIALAENGGIYVARQLNIIEKYDSLGNLELYWGSGGTGPGQFDIPYGVETDWEGNVWVGDWLNRRVQKFDSQGNFLLEWAPDDLHQTLFSPNDIAIDPLGRVNVLDSGSQRIFVLDDAANVISEWWLGELTGFDLEWAAGLSYDRWGNLYVTDAGKGQVFRFQLRPYNIHATALIQSGAAQGGMALLSANATGNTDPYTYALVDGAGSVDNAQFTIQGSQLVLTSSQAEQESFSVRVRVTNPWGDTYEEAMLIGKAQRHNLYLPRIQR